MKGKERKLQEVEVGRCKREMSVSACKRQRERAEGGRLSQVRVCLQTSKLRHSFLTILALPLCFISRVRVFASQTNPNGRRLRLQKEGQDCTHRHSGHRFPRRLCLARCLCLLLLHPQQGLRPPQKPQKRFGSLFGKCAEFQCSLCIPLQTPEIIRWNCC